MNIKIIRPEIKKYVELRVGDVFVIRNNICMKTNQDDHDTQLGGVKLAVRLSDGFMLSIPKDTKVEIAKCELVVEIGAN